MKKRIWMACAFILMAVSMCRWNVRAAYVSTGHQKYTYSEMEKDLEQLSEKYPMAMTYQVIGKSADDRNLYEVILGNPEAKKHLIVIANLHAREYMTTQLTMKQIEYYCQNYHKTLAGKNVKRLLSKVAIHIVPSANPDGTAISQSGFNAIRNDSLRKALKKMSGSSRRWKANARGVDLNRNWNVRFRKKGHKGGSGFTGNKAASEPETKALVTMVNRIRKSYKVVGVVSYHSTGSILYGRCAKQASKSVKKYTTKMYKVAQKLTGYHLMPTESISSASGCSREYFLYVKKIPCITLEIGRSSCPLPKSEFSSIWKKNKNMLIRQADLFD